MGSKAALWIPEGVSFFRRSFAFPGQLFVGKARLAKYNVS
jgi:hypothetical protein